MTIEIKTKPLNKDIATSSCEESAIINLYVSQNNCTMNQISDNYCLECKSDYAKYPLENKCYIKTDKIDNLYYDKSNDIWEKCETDNFGFYCSICPIGTYIREISLEFCEKCPKGYYNNIKDQNTCMKCPEGFYSDTLGSISCSKCPHGYTSLSGEEKCFLICEAGYYSNGEECLPCEPGYYSLGGTDKCLECDPGTFNPVSKNDHCEECDFGYYNDEFGSLNCKKCPINFYSDEKGLTYCKPCEENKYSLIGYKECKLMEEIIPHCTILSRENVCLKCDNKAIAGFYNCSVCENNIDWTFTGEYCKLIINCPKYFYRDKNNNNKINCIEDSSECPEDMIYVNLDTGECKEDAKFQDFVDFEYKVNGDEEVLNKVSDKILFEYKEFPDAFEDFLTKNKIIIRGINSNLQIGREEILKEKDKKNLGIDFGECPSIIRSHFNIQQGNELIYKAIDIELNKTKYVDYHIYDTTNLTTPLNLTACKNQTVTIVNPPLDYIENFKDIETFKSFYLAMKNGIEIFNIYSPLYQDPCFQLTISNRYDLTLTQRRNILKRKNITVCEDNCESGLYEGENLKIFQIVCRCPIGIDKSLGTPSLFKQGFLDVKNRHNFDVLKCYKLTFSKKGQTYNYFSYFLIVLKIN